jgi:hypothetical protein
MIKFGLKCQQKQQNMEELDFAITQTSHWFSTQNLLLMQLSAIVSRIQRHISIEKKFGANSKLARERWKYICFGHGCIMALVDLTHGFTTKASI